MNLALLLACLCQFISSKPEFDPSAVFGRPPGRDVDSALKRAEKEKKMVLLFSYDPAASSLPTDIFVNFMHLPEAKKLVKEHFVVVFLVRGHHDLKRYPSPGAAEKPYCTFIRPDGKAAKAAIMYWNESKGGLDVLKEMATAH